MPPSRFIPGSFWRTCERTGFRVRAEDSKKEWTGLIVRREVWEQRHPQDFVRAVNDDQTVPDARPAPVMEFSGPLTTTLTAAASAGATSLDVVSTTRMEAGDTIRLILANGESHRTTISVVVDSTSLTVPALPFGASSGALLINETALSEPDIG